MKASGKKMRHRWSIIRARSVRLSVASFIVTITSISESSRIRKSAPDADSAETMSAATAVPFAGANRPKLMKRVASQQTTSMIFWAS